MINLILNLIVIVYAFSYVVHCVKQKHTGSAIAVALFILCYVSLFSLALYYSLNT
ncbi:MAG TPA: hypothetical protein P5116_04440 [Eubacteriales bacterium]|nr:hypothetical protein [Clostridia bacterium]HRV73112.1 hypothetical protein [Eubacteriales bacterium]